MPSLRIVAFLCTTVMRISSTIARPETPFPRRDCRRRYHTSQLSDPDRANRSFVSLVWPRRKLGVTPIGATGSTVWGRSRYFGQSLSQQAQLNSPEGMTPFIQVAVTLSVFEITICDFKSSHFLTPRPESEGYYGMERGSLLAGTSSAETWPMKISERMRTGV